MSKTIDEIANEVCDKLPEGFNIIIELEEGYGAVNLNFPDGEVMQYDLLLEDDNIEALIYKALNCAITENSKNEGN